MFINKIKENKIYNTGSSIELINNNSHLNYSNLIFLFGYFKKDFENLLETSLFSLKKYKSIYHPKIFKINSINKNLIFNTKDYYLYINNKYPNINNFKQTISQYNNLNLIYDLSYIIKFFNQKTFAKSTRKYQQMKELIENICLDPNFNSYLNKFILIPLDTTQEIYNKVDYRTEYDYYKNLILPKNKFNTSSNPIYNIDFKIFLKNKMFNLKHTLPVSFFMEYFKEFELLNKSISLKDFIFIFYSANFKYLYKINGKNLSNFKTIYKRINIINTISNNKFKELSKEEFNDIKYLDEIDKIPQKNSFINKLKEKFNIVEDEQNLTAIEKEQFNLIKSQILKIENNSNSTNKIEDEINLDQNLLNDINTFKNMRNASSYSDVEVKILEKLKNNQKDLTFKNKKIEDILNDQSYNKLEKTQIPKKNLIHEEFQKSSLLSLDRSYKEKLLDKDILNAFKAFENDPSDPLIMQSIDIEDSSNNLDYKNTYTIIYKNKHNKKFKITLDIPEIIDNKFFYLNGGKKIMSRQIVSMPLIKNKIDEVFVCTNYNKFQILKKGNKLDNKIDGFLKTIQNNKKLLESKGIKILPGNNLKLNIKFINTAEYNYISQAISEINIKNSNSTFLFNRKEAENNYPSSANAEYFPFGKNSQKNIIYYISNITGEIFADKYLLNEAVEKSISFYKVSNSILDFFISEFNQYIEFEKLLINEINNTGKNFTYSTIGILKRRISVLMLLAFYKGFFKILQDYKVDYKIVEKNIKLTDKEKLIKNIIPFKDYNLIYESTPKNNMLLHGLSEIATREYEINSLNKEEFFLDYFDNTYNSRNVAKGFKLILDRMIDPITFKILEELKYPTDIVGLILEANTILSNVKYITKNNMENYRIRSLETLPVILFRTLASEYNVYKITGRFNIPKDRLIKNLLSENIVNEYSVLNIPNELMELSSASWKGPGGINSSDAYTADIRSYDESMLGIFGGFSPIDAKVGTVRHLSYNTNIKNLRGFLEIPKNKENLDTTQLFSPVELINPFNATMSDPMRTAMNVRQTAHIIPTEDTDAPIIGTGIEGTIPYLLGKDFVFVAEKDGKIKEINEKYQLMIIQYDDGSEDVIDLSENISKNSQGGFFINNHLETEYKVNHRFKKGDILAKNNTFFKGEKNNVSIAIGTLSKVAMLCLDGTMEDGSFITEKLSNKLTSYVTMQEELIIGTDTNISQIVKIGDYIKVGEPLAIFETVFDDSDAINLIDKIGEKYKEDIKELSNTTKKAHFSGEIIDIKLYYNRDLEEFTPSVQKLIKSYIKTIKEKELKIKSLNTKEKPNIFLPITKKYENEKEGKIKNYDVNGLLIEFYIRHADKMHLGDKITFQGACKTIVTETIKDDEAPYSDFRKDEPIDAIFSPLSLVTRMIVDLPNNMLGNKALIELKKKIQEIYNE